MPQTIGQVDRIWQNPVCPSHPWYSKPRSFSHNSICKWGEPACRFSKIWHLTKHFLWLCILILQFYPDFATAMLSRVFRSYSPLENSDRQTVIVLRSSSDRSWWMKNKLVWGPISASIDTGSSEFRLRSTKSIKGFTVDWQAISFLSCLYKSVLWISPSHQAPSHQMKFPTMSYPYS